jgi:hypothetical protein
MTATAAAAPAATHQETLAVPELGGRDHDGVRERRRSQDQRGERYHPAPDQVGRL